MANNITGASLSDIYSQLSGVSSYHPFDADTFSDWSLEAGDIITVKRGTTEYSSPVTQTRMTWKGTPTMTVSATGNEKREPIAKVSKKKYSRGSGGMRNQQGLYLDFYSSDGYFRSVLSMTASDLQIGFDNSISSLHSELLMTAESLHTEFDNLSSSLHSELQMTAESLHTEFENLSSDVGSLRSELTQTAESLHTQFDNLSSSLHSEITQTAESLHTEFESLSSDVGSLRTELTQTASGIYADLEATASSLHTYIETTASGLSVDITNGLSGLSTRIDVQAGSISTVITGMNNISSRVEQTDSAWRASVEGVASNGKITAASICAAINGDSTVNISANRITLDGTTHINDVMTVGENTVYINKTLRAESGIMSPSIVLRSGNDDVTISAAIAGDIIKSASIVDTNTLSLVSISGTVVNFSKATTLSGRWSGNTYTVTATPQGNSIHTNTFVSLPEWDIMNNKATVDFYYFDNNNISTRILPATINIGPKLLDKTGNNKFERNGRYNAHSAGYIGYGEIIIDVPQGIESSNIRTKFSGAPGSYYIEAVDNQTSTPISGTTTQYNLGARSQYVEIQTTSGARMPGGAYVTLGLNRGTISSSGTRDVTVKVDGVDTIVSQHFTDYNDGYEDTHFDQEWVKNTAASPYKDVLNVTKTRLGSTNSIRLAVTENIGAYSYISSTHKYSVTGYAYVNGEPRASAIRISGTEAYDAGWSAVRIHTTRSGNVFTITKSSTGTLSSKMTVTATQPDFVYNSSGHYFEVTGAAVVNGASVSTATRNTSAVAYNYGWSDVRLSAEWSGNKYTVTKAESGDLSTSVTVTAGTPAFTYNDSTHCYDLAGTAYAGGACRHKKTTSTGTEAYSSGHTAGVTEGYSGAHLSGHWGTGANNYNIWTVEKVSTGNANAISTTVTSGLSSFTYHSDTHKYSVTAYAYADDVQKYSKSGSTGTEAYDAGWSAVRLSSSWSGNKWTVKKDNDGSPSSAEITVTAGSPTATYNSANHCYDMVGTAWALGACRHKATNSTDTSAYTDGYSVGMRESTGGYASGWRECYSTVRLDSTEEKTLDYGTSIRVYAQAKTSSTAQTHTNIESRVIKAPNDRVCSIVMGSWNGGKKKVDLIIDGTTASTQYAEISAMGDEWDTTISPTTSRYVFTANSGKANATLDAGIIVNCCNSSAKFSVSTAVTNAFRDGYSAGHASSYQEGYDAGVASVRITPTWTKATESSTYSNKLTVTTSTDSSKNTSYNYTITAGLATLTYNSTTHTYSTTAYAYAGGETKDTKTGSSGNEALNDGYSYGRDEAKPMVGDTASSTWGARYATDNNKNITSNGIYHLITDGKNHYGGGYVNYKDWYTFKVAFSKTAIQLGNAKSQASRPTGTELTKFRTPIKEAYTGRKYLVFEAWIDGSPNDVKTYYVNLE